MGLLQALKDAWRKNSPELTGLWNGGLPHFVTARAPAECNGVPVFCYHITVAESFEADLRFLAANDYEILTAADFLAYLEGQRKVQRAVLLAFDDGARNFYDVAFPILKRFRAHAVHFVAPGLHADAGPGDEMEDRPMNWSEMREIHASGLVSFQSHTLESRYVPNWPLPVPLAGCDPTLEASRRRNALELAEDLVRSRAELGRHLPGVQVDQLAFPMYEGTDAATQIARSVGFRACYWGLQPGRPLNRTGDSPLRISRVSEEYVRRLPGKGRISLGAVVQGRLDRIKAARAWRQKTRPAAPQAA